MDLGPLMPKVAFIQIFCTLSSFFSSCSGRAGLNHFVIPGSWALTVPLSSFLFSAFQEKFSNLCGFSSCAVCKLLPLLYFFEKLFSCFVAESNLSWFQIILFSYTWYSLKYFQDFYSWDICRWEFVRYFKVVLSAGVNFPRENFCFSW